MTVSKIALLFLLAAVCLGWMSCLEKVPEELVGSTPSIPVPFGLEAIIANGEIDLSWDEDESFQYAEFRVYRSDDGQTTWSLVGKVQGDRFVDTSVRNGHIYWYRVAGVDADGLEGEPSTALPARPGIFALIINGGEDYSGSRDVVIDFTAPVETRSVMVFEMGVPSDSLWLPYEPRKQFRLSEGEGVKAVGSRFEDDLGNLSVIVSDSIFLDTHADIAALSFAPAGLVPPETEIHFDIESAGDEKGGTVEITVPGIAEPIVALDDGTMGDSTAGDGLYSRDYQLPSSFRQRGVVPLAVFVDAAGNRSAPREFATGLGITDPPSPVYLFPPTDSTASSVTVRWGESDDEYFARYDLYRDASNDVAADHSPRVAIVFDRLTISYTDVGLKEGTEYFYRVYVVNDLGEMAPSSVRRAETEDPPPDAVVCDPPSSVGADRLTLTWSASTANDFKEYRVFRATSPGVTESNGVLVGGPIADRYTTFLDDTGLDLAGNTYYYRVYVYDSAGQSARSNEVSSQ